MNRWKVAAAAAVGVIAMAMAIAVVPVVRGQERPGSDAPRASVFRFADWSGAQIGVTVHDVASGNGVIVDEVRQDGPAAKAGVQEKDVIIDFDGERVRSARQFTRIVTETPQGRSVKMAIQRGGQRMMLDVTPEERSLGRVAPVPFEKFTLPEIPDMPAMPRMREFDRRIMPEIEMYSSRAGRLGVQLEDVQDQLAQYFGVKSGALITSVADGTPGARAGLKAGDILTKVNGQTVEDTRDVRRELRRADPGKEFPVDVIRDRKPLSLKVTLDPPASASKRPGTPA